MPVIPHTRASSSIALLLFGVLLGAAPVTARSQSAAPSDSSALPFRAGQWGAEFALGSYSSAGFVRFREPNRAWVGTIGGQYQRSSRGDLAGDRTFTRLDLTVGHRWFRPMLPAVSQFVSIGAVAGWQRTEIPTPFTLLPDQTTGTVSFRNSSLLAGVVADVGAQWMVIPSLSLGAKWGAQVLLGRDSEQADRANGTAGPKQTGTSASLLLGRIAVLGTLYF
jgi:hypothetical protein